MERIKHGLEMALLIFGMQFFLLSWGKKNHLHLDLYEEH